ncbi:MAG: diacylglycerol kinase family lipid kinase [Planctomycetes bacterium]|nr:diacylglycerol kinase family lipid kinase [Planctomycetota bacterium]
MPSLPFQRALVIVNPIAGRGRAERAARELAAALEREGVAVELFATSRKGDARDRAARIGPELERLVVVGGDGTVSEVLEGLTRHELPILILPMGTANVMGLDLRLPRGAAGALEVLRTGRLQALDVARVNGRSLSFLVTGAGLDALIVRELERVRRGPISKWTWVLAGLRVFLRYREPRLQVELDGAPVEGRFGFVLFSNVIHYGGSRVLSRERKLDDGLFEAYLFTGCSRLGLVGHALRALFGGFPSARCERRRARRMRVRAEEPVPFQVDGDFGGETPLEIEVLAQGFTLLVP